MARTADASQPDAKIDAKTRILDAAEKLFMENGYAATSIRMITGAAGVPVALVNYHFGSKQGLMEAVYERALGSRGGSRVSYLDKLEAEAGGGPVPVEVLVDAFLSTALRLTRRDNISGAVFKQLIGRAFYEPGPGTEAFFPQEYQEAIDRYRQAFMRTLPHLSQEDVVWRMYFFVGITAYAMSGKVVLHMTDTYALTDAGDPEAILARLRPFVVAGFKGPAGERVLI